MARPNKVWFRKDVGWWMVTIAGKKIRLAQGKANRKLVTMPRLVIVAICPIGV